jgi:hypothetical protein
MRSMADGRVWREWSWTAPAVTHKNAPGSLVVKVNSGKVVGYDWPGKDTSHTRYINHAATDLLANRLQVKQCVVTSMHSVF